MMTHTDAASSSELPPGWTESRVRDVIAHYESQSDDEAIAEDESAFEADDYTVMAVPCELVPVVQTLLTEFASRGVDRP